jgi:hypothetical protein
VTELITAMDTTEAAGVTRKTTRPANMAKGSGKCLLVFVISFLISLSNRIMIHSWTRINALARRCGDGR